MLLCYDKKYLGAHGIDPLDISAYVHDAGQPTVHVNVLREGGLPRYTCRVDERAPLYHVGEASEYAPQQLFVADGDILCRYEETMLLYKTFESLKYDMSKIRLEYMQGYSHTQYLGMENEQGISIFGERVYKFLSDILNFTDKQFHLKITQKPVQIHTPYHRINLPGIGIPIDQIP
jgi:hypothetical protein